MAFTGSVGLGDALYGSAARGIGDRFEATQQVLTAKYFEQPWHTRMASKVMAAATAAYATSTLAAAAAAPTIPGSLNFAFFANSQAFNTIGSGATSVGTQLFRLETIAGVFSGGAAMVGSRLFGPRFQDFSRGSQQLEQRSLHMQLPLTPDKSYQEPLPFEVDPTEPVIEPDPRVFLYNPDGSTKSQLKALLLAGHITQTEHDIWLQRVIDPREPLRADLTNFMEDLPAVFQLDVPYYPDFKGGYPNGRTDLPEAYEELGDPEFNFEAALDEAGVDILRSYMKPVLDAEIVLKRYSSDTQLSDLLKKNPEAKTEEPKAKAKNAKTKGKHVGDNDKNEMSNVVNIGECARKSMAAEFDNLLRSEEFLNNPPTRYGLSREQLPLRCVEIALGEFEEKEAFEFISEGERKLGLLAQEFFQETLDQTQSDDEGKDMDIDSSELLELQRDAQRSMYGLPPISSDQPPIDEQYHNLSRRYPGYFLRPTVVNSEGVNLRGRSFNNRRFYVVPSSSDKEFNDIERIADRAVPATPSTPTVLSRIMPVPKPTPAAPKAVSEDGDSRGGTQRVRFSSMRVRPSSKK